jgi:hypothetical protein
MAKARPSEPKVSAIVAAQAELISRLPNLEDTEPHELGRTCWACGYTYTTDTPARAHIIPASQNGPSEPTNYFLLCERCHKAQPDSLSRETQIAWIMSRPAYLSTLLVELRPVIEAITGLVSKAGLGESFVDEWSAQFSVERIVALSGLHEPAGKSLSNARSNIAWLAFEDFKRWITWKAPGALKADLPTVTEPVVLAVQADGSPPK